MKLTNKTILITGGTSGIGNTLAQALQKHNKVILLGKDPVKLEKARQQGFLTIPCDLSKQEDIEKAAITVQNDYPDLAVLFNNAGVQYNYLFTSSVMPLDKIGQEMDINFTGQAVLTQLLIPVLMTKEQALIVNTTSGLAYFPKLNGLVYSASKAALRSFTTGLRYALCDSNVKVVEFIPPVTATNMTADRDENKMTPQELIRIILPQLEKGRKVVTTGKLRLFPWIAFLFPGLAHKILSK